MKPIIFSTPMVRAILDGRKKCTRRVVKPQPPQFVDYFEKRGDGFKAYMVPGEPCDYPLVKPKYQPGDVLWVRETWAKRIHSDNRYYYKADNNLGAIFNREDDKWRPSIFMPREAARLFLRVKNVRVERLQDITEEDAKAEGVICGQGQKRWTARSAFMDLWDRINGKKNPWESNPWVWVIEFEMINKPQQIHL